MKNNFVLRCCAALSAAVSMMTITDWSVLASPILPSDTYTGDCFEVTYNVTNHWSDRYQCEMIIRNTGTEPIQDWSLAFVSDQNYDQIWNCTAESVNGLTVFHNAGYNQDIAVGEAVYIGFIMTADEVDIPEKYALLGEPDALSPDTYTAELSVMENWGTGYTAALTVTNNTTYTIEDWSLEFDWDQAITSIWNAEVTAQDGNHFFVSNAGYNQNIAAGSSVTICIQGESSAEEVGVPSNVVLTEYGESRRTAIDELFNVRSISVDVSDLILSDEGYYIVKDHMDTICGNVKPGLLATEAHYTIENAWGMELFSGSFTPNSAWSIPDIGFVLGMNKLTVDVAFSDGKTSESVVWLGNFNEDNMKNVPIDMNDPDSDGLISYLEELYGTNPKLADTDGDTISDYLELTEFGTNPNMLDTDEDGVNDGDEDPDKDGVTTSEEHVLGTDPRCVDTDGDELTDSEELYDYGTNPLEPDTDGDDVDDGWEIRNDTDPLSADDFSTFEQTVKGDTNSAEITVTAEDGRATTLTVTPLIDDIKLNPAIPGYMGCGFDFEMEGEFTSAVLKITFDESYLVDAELAPVIYYYNEETGELEEIETEWDGVSNYVTAKLPHFSKYILLNRKSVEDVIRYDLENYGTPVRSAFEFVFAIDSSGSMVSNDSTNIRLTVAKEFVDNMNASDKALVLAFDSANYFYTTEFTSDKAVLKNAIDRVGHNGSSTYIGGAIDGGLAQFSGTKPDNVKRFLIVLTDGIAHDKLPVGYAETAEAKGVQIITIGLGNGVNQSYLQMIAEATAPAGRKALYYFASVANDLTSIFTSISDDIKKDSDDDDNDDNDDDEDEYKDSNNDGITDKQTKAFCDGILTTLYGENPFAGKSYELVQKDTDGDLDNDGLLNGEEVHIPSKYADSHLLIFMHSDPTNEDTDNDGMNDGKEVKQGTNPLRGDFDKDKVDELIDDDSDLFLSSMMSEDYLDSNTLKIKLFLGNFLFGGFNVNYVDDYEEQIISLVNVLTSELASSSAIETLKKSVENDASRVFNRFYPFMSCLNELGVMSADFAKAKKEMEESANLMVSLEAQMQHVDDLVEMEGMLTEYAAKKADLLAHMETAKTKFSRAWDKAEEISKVNGDDLMGDLGKFVIRTPDKLQSTMKAVKAFGTVIDFVTISAQKYRNINNDIMAISYICTAELEYGKSIELLDAVIEYTDNSDMRKAAKNLKNAIGSEIEKHLLISRRVTEEIVSGTAQFSINYSFGEAGPVGFAIMAGITVGELLWHTGSVDTQSLATIAMGDINICYAEYVSSFLEDDNEKYYVLSDDSYYRMSVLAQTRIVGENEFNKTAQEYSWLYDLLTGIKDSVEDAVQWTINDIYNFANSNPLIYCNPNYEGATVTI